MSKREDEVLEFVRNNPDLFLPQEAQRDQNILEFVKGNPELFQNEGEDGFLKRYGSAFLDLFKHSAMPALQQREDVARSSMTGAGILESAIVTPIEGVAGAAADVSEFIQGLPGIRNVPSLKFGQGEEGQEYRSVFRAIEDFAHRFREGTLTDLEVDALNAGMTPQEIATAKGLGHFIGFTVPLMASFGATRVLFNVPQVATRYPWLTGVLYGAPQELVAGAIYGGLFEPAGGATQRLKHMLNGSALFGVSRLMLNGLAFPVAGALSKRANLKIARDNLDNMIERMRNGEEVVVGEQEAAALGSLLTEEEYIVSSLKAQSLIEKNKARESLVQAIIDSSGAKDNSGIVRNLPLTFTEVSKLVGDYRAEFPKLKFDVVAGDSGYHVVFGTRGLSNFQKSQLKKTGRFTGLMVEKGGSKYVYVSEAGTPKGDNVPWINVVTMSEKVTKIKDEGVTDLFTYRETFEPDNILNDLFDDFFTTIEREKSQFLTEGTRTEADIIKGIREGTIELSPDARRAFNVDGAIINPEEIGLRTSGPESVTGITFSKEGRVGRLQRVEDGGSWSFVEFPKNPSDPPNRIVTIGEDLTKAVDKMEKGGWKGEEIRYVTPRGEEVAQDIMREGTLAGGLMKDSFSYVTLDDLMEGWAKVRGIPNDTPDWPAMKGYFTQETRKRLWKSVPEADRKIFTEIQDEAIRLANEGEIPIKAQAHNKGLQWIEGEDGKITLRDIRTGATVTFQNEVSAKDALKHIHRPDKDMVDTLVPFDTPGMSGMTGGWEAPGAMLFFDEKFDPKIFLDDLNSPTLMKVRNVRDLFLFIERKTGFGLFTEVFDKIDLGISSMRRNLEPLAIKVDQAFKGLSRKGRGSRTELVNWWTEIEGSNLSMKEAIKYLKERGATTKQQVAYRKAREIWDYMFKLSGIEQGRYIHHYYSRIRPWVEEHGVAPDLEIIYGGKDKIPPEFRFWAEQTRTGELAMIETDPLAVMQRYARSLMFKLEVEPHYARALKLLDDKTAPRIRDFPKDLRDEILASSPRAHPDDPILPPSVRDILKEYLAIIRGTPEASVEGLRKFTKKFFNSMGIDANPRTLETFIDIHISNMYGAAMGLRASLTARNATQTIWTLYTRLGGRWGGPALERSMTHEGYAEPLAAGAIRSQTAGLPYGDVLNDIQLEEGMVHGRNAASKALASVLRLGMRVGYGLNRASRKMLIPYSSTDDLNRAWAYWWQKLHAQEFLEKYEKGKIPWDKVIEDGLPFFPKPIHDKFQKLYRENGAETALRWIGKMGADEAHWIYGIGAQPALMQKPVGRYVGMFGTWPLWASELYFQRTKHATFKQQAALFVRTAALIGAYGNMIAQTGYDLWKWIAPASVMTWSGGPIVDVAIAAKDLIEAENTLEAKGRALKHLARNSFSLGYPGQYFIRDLGYSLDSRDPVEGAIKMILGRNVDDKNIAFDMLYRPTNLQNLQMFNRNPVYVPPAKISLGGTR